MKTSVLIILLLSTLTFTFSQESEKKTLPDVHDYIAVDKEPLPLNLYLIQDKIGYPVKALKNRIEGKVFSRVLVNTEGDVIQFVLTRNDHPVLGAAVEAELESLRFQPAYLDGEPINYWTNVPFKFYLKQTINSQPKKHNYRTLVQKVFKSNRSKAEQLLTEGLALFKKREYKMAGKNFKECIQRTPRQKSNKSQEILFQARLNLAHAYVQLKSWELAERHYTEAIGLARAIKSSEVVDQHICSAYLGRAYSLLKAEDYLRSITDYNHVSRHFEDRLLSQKEGQRSFPFPWRQDLDWVMYQRGLVYLQLNKNQEAIENFQKVCELEPASRLQLVALSHMGLAQSKMGDFEAAFNNIQAAIEIDGDDPQPYYFKAMVLMELESQDMASDLIQQARKLFAKLDGDGNEIPSAFPANEE